MYINYVDPFPLLPPDFTMSRLKNLSVKVLSVRNTNNPKVKRPLLLLTP